MFGWHCKNLCVHVRLTSGETRLTASRPWCGTDTSFVTGCRPTQQKLRQTCGLPQKKELWLTSRPPQYKPLCSNPKHTQAWSQNPANTGAVVRCTWRNTHSGIQVSSSTSWHPLDADAFNTHAYHWCHRGKRVMPPCVRMHQHTVLSFKQLLCTRAHARAAAFNRHA
jgi:hypothetical protein